MNNKTITKTEKKVKINQVKNKIPKMKEQIAGQFDLRPWIYTQKT